ncbi:helix-turn-helix domain-containing protein [Rugamonas rubra]|uniref:Helix-turn-helix domain-containing protein n=1 Tax=Rugamonas rubra TaxID=758825 RepID=A0A1I4MLD2_9BURK|nr:helix-turn-helix transcriptional regulator [Rugamonas rubra]SFM04051.1 Helix-turn-helix domain-containing protein [Rugamonas rubra]
MDADLLKQWFDALPVDPADTVKLEFAVALDLAIRELGLSRKQVAELLKTSPAWVTKVLRGDVNLTIESMVKLCDAVGHQLQISIVKKNAIPLRTAAPRKTAHSG